MSTLQYAATEDVYIGDGMPQQQFQLYDDVTGEPVNFTLMPAPSVSLQLTRVGSSVVVLTKACTLEIPDSGWVSVTFLTADLTGAVPGLYEARVVVDTGAATWTAQNRLRYRLIAAL